MKKHWYGWITLLALLALLMDLYAFAGLRRVPDVGRAVAVQARMQSPLTYTYLVAGRQALRYTPFMQHFADSLAAATWGDAYEPVRQSPELALDQLSGASHGTVNSLMVLAYWAPLVLFPLALAGWYFRPRKVSLIRHHG